MGQGQSALVFLRALHTPTVRKRSSNVGNTPWGGFTQQEGLSSRSSADKIVLLGTTTVAALPGVPTLITARALWLSPFLHFHWKKALLFLPHSRRVLRALLC